jgi:hypothetical protein
LVDSVFTYDATFTDTVLTIPSGIIITSWLSITDTLASFNVGVGGTRRRASKHTVATYQDRSLCAFRLLQKGALISVQIAVLWASRGALQNTATFVQFEIWRAVWLRIGMLLTPVVDRNSPIRAFAIDRLCETNLSVPGHVRWAAARRATCTANRKSCTRLALQLTSVDAFVVVQLRVGWALRYFDSSTRLSFGVETAAIAALRSDIRSALSVLRNCVLRATWHLLRNASCTGRVEGSSFGASGRFIINADTIFELGTIRAFGPVE